LLIRSRRNHNQQELDLVEDADGQLNAFEFTRAQRGKKTFPAAFLDAYPGSATRVVDQSNFTDFILWK